MDIAAVSEQVKYNCNVSDAGAWGYYSICGLLMRMRDLYRHEHSMKPWQPLGDEALEWVAEREALWEELGDKEPGAIVLNGRSYGPFDVEGINAVLTKHGYVYGGGYGMFSKPTFFLARLREKSEVEGFTVYRAGQEITRDISASPAMLQNGTIFIRDEPLQAILWDKFLHLKGRKFGGVLKEAFSLYGISGAEEPSETLFEKFGLISSEIAALLMRHELGEAVEDDDAWLEILSANTDKLVEVSLRGVKDLIADTSESGPIQWIVKTRNRALLYFYIVLFDGVRKGLFPEIMNAFQEFVERENWHGIEEARLAGYRRSRDIARMVLDIWAMKRDMSAVKTFIAERLKK